MNAVMAACSQAGEWGKVLELFDTYISPYMDPQNDETFSENSFVLAISALIHNGNLQRAIQLLNQMTIDYRFPMSTAIFKRFITSPVTAKPKFQNQAWNTVLDLTDEIIQRGFVLDHVCFTAAIDSISATIKQENKIEYDLEKVLSRLGVFSITNSDLIAKVMGSLRRVGSSDLALRLFEDAKQRNIQLKDTLYGAAMWAYSSSKNLNKVLDILNESRQNNIMPTTVSYNAALAACGNDQLTHAMQLYEEMQRVKVEPNANTFGILISLQEENGNLQQANALMVQARGYGLYQTIWQRVDTISIYGLSPPETRTALRLALQVASQHIEKSHLKVPNKHQEPLLIINGGRGRLQQVVPSMFEHQGEFSGIYDCEEDIKFSGNFRIRLLSDAENLFIENDDQKDKSLNLSSHSQDNLVAAAVDHHSPS
eukprot:CAMPEP_0197311052 /NCGR_PEP_ID=MMETSP0891-20130614/9571_1 /TAXON_ID=44058 ORGANISM="Aureoumbra lagunensis, Strain CCMP1510" /NCGR_SAMPLE_ID=MMETSP0891 /ASSEMBLY_ACC=CAM_ASM_000534 /LENGTH=425 /DNA_ID=CAMNT_0042796977 /DNA_START=819 /DNA_END=2096 /DNA_ORIENTATION=-